MNMINDILPLLQFVGYVVTATIFVVMIKADIRVIAVQIEGITKRIDGQQESFVQLGEILRQVSVQDNRIGNLEGDIREIRHGRGFIVGVQGEYTRGGKVEN